MSSFGYFGLDSMIQQDLEDTAIRINPGEGLEDTLDTNSDGLACVSELAWQSEQAKITEDRSNAHLVNQGRYKAQSFTI